MRKRLIAIIVIACITCTLCACNKGATATNTATNAVNTTDNQKQDVKEIKCDLPKTIKEVGDGTITLRTAGGTSENGQVPVVYASKDAQLLQVELDAHNFNGSKLSYIFIDDILNTKVQLADSQQSITLSNKALKEGTHKVSVVQYENDKIGGTVITYKSAGYQIKEK